LHCDLVQARSQSEARLARVGRERGGGRDYLRGMPQLTIDPPRAARFGSRSHRDTLGNATSSKAFRAAMEAFGVEEVARPRALSAYVVGCAAETEARVMVERHGGKLVRREVFETSWADPPRAFNDVRYQPIRRGRVDEQPESGSDEGLRHKILKLRKQGREWEGIAVDIGLVAQRASVQTRLSRMQKSEVARAILQEELNDSLRTGDMYGRG
jgi:hypothetical protein